MMVWSLQSGRYPLANSRGAAISGGRWNLQGTEVIYASATLGLAALEVIAHFSAVPHDYIGIEISIPDQMQIATPHDLSLPDDWRDIVPEEATAAYGTAWAQSGSTVVLRVPSAVIPNEFNFILNAAHPEFSRIIFRQTKVEIDRRIRKPRP